MPIFANFVNSLGRYVIFTTRGLTGIVRPHLSLSLLLQQMEFVGNRSFAIIALSGMMIGAVFGFQIGHIFRLFGAEGMIGAAAGYGLSKELAPIIGSFLVTGRAGSAMAAEIGTMRVNEQIDAMRVMTIDPYNYLVAPRVVASVIMMPLLVSIFILAGVFSSFLIGVSFFNVDIGTFMEQIHWIVKPHHILEGLQKAVLFGFMLSSIACYHGFHASGGAKSVGRASTVAVVTTLVTILVADFFVSYIQYRLQ